MRRMGLRCTTMNENDVIKEILDAAKADFYALKHMGIDITQEKIERYANIRCDFESCFYNNNGTCQNKEKKERVR